MHTPKKSVSKSSMSEVPEKSSPTTLPRKTSVVGSESNSSSSSHPRKKATTKNRNCPASVSELGSRITQLQEDLKKTKDQLAASESWKKQAEGEAEENKKLSMAAMAKFEEVQKQVKDLTDAEDAHVQELRQIGQERDRAWQLELEALQKQHSVDSAALLSAMNEVTRLRQQVEMLSCSKVAPANKVVADSELQKMKDEMVETLSLVSSLETQLENSEKCEEEYHILVNQTQVELDIAKSVMETLRLEGSKVVETLNSTMSELKEYKARACSLEEAINKSNTKDGLFDPHKSDRHALQINLDLLNSEVEHLKVALEEAMMKCNEEQIKCIMQIQSAHEAVECIKIQSDIRESALQVTIQEAKEETVELRKCIVDKEEVLTQLKEKLNSEKYDQDKEMESNFKLKIQESVTDIADLRKILEDKEAELRDALVENELLKSEIKKKENERIKSEELAKAEIDKVRSGHQEILTKMAIITEEADKSSRRAARVTEQLETMQAANSEMETELKRLRIQSDQWRKAAEVASDFLSSGTNGNVMDRMNSFGPNRNSLGGKLLNSPFSDDGNDESPKKKHMLKKISGVLWKKGQKY